MSEKPPQEAWWRVAVWIFWPVLFVIPLALLAGGMWLMLQAGRLSTSVARAHPDAWERVRDPYALRTVGLGIGLIVVVWGGRKILARGHSAIERRDAE